MNLKNRLRNTYLASGAKYLLAELNLLHIGYRITLGSISDSPYRISLGPISDGPYRITLGRISDESYRITLYRIANIGYLYGEYRISDIGYIAIGYRITLVPQTNKSASRLRYLGVEGGLVV